MKRKISDNDDHNDTSEEDDETDGDGLEDGAAYDVVHKERNNDPALAHTVKELLYADCAEASSLEGEEDGDKTVSDVAAAYMKKSKLYLVGTAHFSLESQQDVEKLILDVQPDVVMVELCPSRIGILSMDEETLLEEAKNLNREKIMTTIKQAGLVQGVLHVLLLSMSAHITKQLGMAPGGEFRTAFKAAQRVPGCRLVLGDRPIQATLQRALASLSVWQKCRLFWQILVSHKSSISKEDVERCKQSDLLEELLREMAGEFPDLTRIFVDERDQYMAHALRSLLRNAAQHRLTRHQRDDAATAAASGDTGRRGRGAVQAERPAGGAVARDGRRVPRPDAHLRRRTRSVHGARAALTAPQRRTTPTHTAPARRRRHRCSFWRHG